MSQMSRLIFLILQITDACSADGRCQPLREEPVVGGCGFVARGESLFWNQGSYTRWITQRMEWNGLKMSYVLSIFTRQAALSIPPPFGWKNIWTCVRTSKFWLTQQNKTDSHPKMRCQMCFNRVNEEMWQAWPFWYHVVFCLSASNIQ